MKKLTTKECIAKFKAKHGNRYIYIKVRYYGGKIKVKIICREHGLFWMMPNNHLSGNGCPDCGAAKRAKNIQRSKEDFADTANKLWNFEYEYLLDTFVNMNTKMDIRHKKCNNICSITPHNHLSKHGCSKCGFERTIAATSLTREEFIERLVKIYRDQFDYSQVIYKNGRTEVDLTCKKCNTPFSRTPQSLLFDYCGCPACPKACSTSKMETDWLDSLEISKEYRQRPLIINGRRLMVDAYDHTTKTVYEFHGDYFHGNPKTTDPNKVHMNGKTMRQLYEATMQREAILKQAGYTIISIWEADWKKQRKEQLKKASNE
jgi:hypothetical protein